jgi:hypothetical protein
VEGATGTKLIENELNGDVEISGGDAEIIGGSINGQIRTEKGAKVSIRGTKINTDKGSNGEPQPNGSNVGWSRRYERNWPFHS